MYAYKFSNTNTELDTTITYERIKKVYDKGYHFGLDNLLDNGCYNLMGWSYVFKDELKRYLFKQYDTWHECYAPNKTLLRKAIYGKIDKIIELED